MTTARHPLHLARQRLQNLSESEVKLIATRNLLPVIQVAVTLLIYDAELLKVPSVFRLLELDITDLFQLVVVDLDAGPLEGEFLLGSLRLIGRFEADKCTGEVCIWENLDRLYFAEGGEKLSEVFYS